MHDAVVLIFADSLGRELSRKGIARRHAGLLVLPELSGVDADVVVDAGVGRTFAERLRSAVASLGHYRRVVIVGRDCPGLRRADVDAALVALRKDDMVLGPDARGGCWLIGLRGDQLDRLDGVRWCVGEDFAELCRRADRVTVLATKADIDHAGDLPAEVLLARPTAVVAAAQFAADHWQLPPPATA